MNCKVFLHILSTPQVDYEISCESFDDLPSGKVIRLKLSGSQGTHEIICKPYYRRTIKGQLHVFAVPLETEPNKTVTVNLDKE